MRILLATILALAATPALAQAPDFTFTVPVEISGTPTVISARIDCVVSRLMRPDGSPDLSGANVIGRGSTVQPVTGGAFNGNVVVAVRAEGLVPASEARGYTCAIAINGTGRTGAGFQAQSGNMAAIYETATGGRLATVVARVRGTITR